MAYNLKPIVERTTNKKPRNIFEYSLYINTDNNHVAVMPFFLTAYFNREVYTKLCEYDWFIFLETTRSAFPLPIGDNPLEHPTGNYVNNWIFSNYKNYELLPKITDYFTEDFTYNDRVYMAQIISGHIENLLVKNAEKYKKLYDAMTLEFNPLWNVDGTETTVRTLERDGTEKTEKGGSDSTQRTHDTEDKTTYDTEDKTVYNSKHKTTYDTEEKTTFNSDDKTTFNSNVKTEDDKTITYQGQEEHTIDTDKASFNANTLQPTETTTDTTQYINREDVTDDDLLVKNTGYNTIDHEGYNTIGKDGNDTLDNSGDDKILKTGDETTAHTGTTTDSMVYNSDSTLTLDTIDTERIEVTRQGNIGVVSSVKLLEEYADLGDYVNFIATISHDVVSELCYMV